MEDEDEDEDAPSSDSELYSLAIRSKRFDFTGAAF